MLNLNSFNMPPEQHQTRQNFHILSATMLKKSIEERNLYDLFSASAEIPDSICLAANPKWANRPFGAVNIVQNSACVCFVAKTILDTPVYQKKFGRISMEDIFVEAESKGYRLWKLSGRNKTLSMATPSVREIQKAFQDDKEIQECTTLEQIYSIAGRPVGIGGSMFFIDNIISSASKYKMSVGFDTRLRSVEEIVQNLKDGFYVPVRVENSVYHNDPTRKEGHYVTIVGLNGNTATVLDSSYDKYGGVRVIPIMRLFAAMTAKEGLVCAWNTRIN